MTAIRRSKSDGSRVLAAGPRGVHQRLAMLVRLLSATAFMKFCTTAEAVLAGGTWLAPPPPLLHAASSRAAAHHHRLVTVRSLRQVGACEVNWPRSREQ